MDAKEEESFAQGLTFILVLMILLIALICGLGRELHKSLNSLGG